MLKPVVFLKPRVVNGPLYQPGEVAGFMPELVAELVREGSARLLEDPGAAPAPAPSPALAEETGTLAGFPYKTAEERQAARAGRKPASGKKG